MNDYTVIATPVGRYWSIQVPEINRVTQARNAREITEMAADLIEIMTGHTNPVLHIHYQISEKLGAHLEALATARREEAAARQRAARELRAAARVLYHDEHLNLADTGAVLGVSHQRASQLIHDPATPLTEAA